MQPQRINAGRDRELAPFRAFLRWLIAGCIAFGAAEVVAWLFLPAWNLLALAGSSLVLGLVATLAYHGLSSSGAGRGPVQWVGYALLLHTLSVSALIPEAEALLPLVPLVGISCALAWLDRPRGLALVVSAAVVTTASLAIAEWLEGTVVFPAELRLPLLIVGAPVLVLLNALVLRQATARVRDALANEHALVQRLQALTSASSHIVWTTDAAGRIVEDCPAWREFTGQTFEEFTGEGWLQAVHPDDRARARQAWRTAVETRSLYSYEYRVLRPDGSWTPCAGKAAPVLAEDGTVREWVGTTIDVSAAKEAEAARERAREQEAHAMRLREQFIAIAGHELRTPITPLKLQLERLAQMLDRGGDLAQPHQVRDRVGRSLEQVRRIEALVESLLDVTQMIGGGVRMRVEQVDLAALTRHVVEHFGREQGRSSGRLRVQASGPVVVECDARRMEQVVTSLVSNALKFGAGEDIHVSVEAREGEAHLRVEDHGMGIPPELQPRLFSRFERGDDLHYAGLGLGLYTSKEIVRLHGGRIEVQSQPGAGSTFVVSLPLRVALAPPAATEARAG